MGNKEMLIQVRDLWMERVSNNLARGEGVREVLSDELNRFYDLLLQAVESGDPGWLKPILIEWAQSRTQSELDEEIALPPIISGIIVQTQIVARETFSPEDAYQLVENLFPIFTYCYEQIAYHETLVRIAYVSTDLERVKSELGRMDRSKSDFISVAAHELKTPLTLIEGYASMLREQFPKDDTSSSPVMLLKGIDNGIRRLSEIVNDMIDVSLIDNDLLSLNFQPTWVNRLLKVLQKELDGSLRERNQTLEIRDFEGSDEMTFADSERIHQALRNVLTNSMKYTPDNGTIVVDGRKLAGFIEVTITDTGIGIDPDDQAQIFEKFGSLGDVALHSSGKLKFKGGGPGLGLPITKGILDAHGGTIWVESEGYDEEKLPGSRFHILIPIRHEPPDEKLAKIYQPLSSEANQAILTDDD
ncbi:MAG: HAMP domain-containing histidine kinase [Chloroflexi bacterium]|nr:HAMP domain-containing histidine kinase [Chloroflexota bacterium]